MLPGEQLATLGSGSLSLRAVAREPDMASSVVYGALETRDVLLTALTSMRTTTPLSLVEGAEGRRPREDLEARWGSHCPHRALVGPG